MGRIRCQNQNHFGTMSNDTYRITIDGQLKFVCRGCLKKLHPEIFKDVTELSITQIVSLILRNNLQ